MTRAQSILAFQGSLRQGFHNHHLLAHCHYAGTITSTSHYTKVDLGRLSGLFHGDTNPIVEEVYRVDALAQLDILEGHPDHYERHVHATEGFGEAWLYIMPAGYLEVGELTLVISDD